MFSSVEKIPLEKCPALVLNADYRPLSYYPLSLWCWQDAVKSVFLNRVSIVSNYERKIRSPSFQMNLPSVIALKSFVKPQRNPNFTRFNVFLPKKPYSPSIEDLHNNGRNFPPNFLHDSWMDYLYWDVELQP